MTNHPTPTTHHPDMLHWTAIGATTVVAFAFLLFAATYDPDAWIMSDGQFFALLIGAAAFLIGVMCWIAVGIRMVLRRRARRA
jgi:hypothetical protein